MEWQPYKDCCVRNAGSLDADVGFCPDCGHPLMRCMAFAECRSLVTPTQPCPTCVAPVLMIDAGAVVTASAGERMSVPLVLLNASTAGRTLWVKRVAKRDGKTEQPITLDWEQLEARTEQGMALDTPPGGLPIAQLLKLSGLTASTSDALRLIAQGGVRVDGARAADKALTFASGRSLVVQVGKRRFARVTLK